MSTEILRKKRTGAWMVALPSGVGVSVGSAVIAGGSVVVMKVGAKVGEEVGAWLGFMGERVGVWLVGEEVGLIGA